MEEGEMDAPTKLCPHDLAKNLSELENLSQSATREVRQVIVHDPHIRAVP